MCSGHQFCDRKSPSGKCLALCYEVVVVLLAGFTSTSDVLTKSQFRHWTIILAWKFRRNPTFDFRAKNSALTSNLKSIVRSGPESESYYEKQLSTILFRLQLPRKLSVGIQHSLKQSHSLICSSFGAVPKIAFFWNNVPFRDRDPELIPDSN